MDSYAIIVGVGEKGCEFSSTCRHILNEADLTVIYSGSKVLAAAAPGVSSTPIVAESEVGVSFGRLYANSTTSPITRLEANEWVSSSPRVSAATIMKSLWGDFIAVIEDPAADIVAILVSPFGQYRLYSKSGPGVWIYASSLEILLRITAIKPSVNWARFGRFVQRSNLLERATCLDDIEQILPGTCEVISQSNRRNETWWTPWQYVIPSEPELDPQEQADRLYETVRDTIARSATRFTRPLVELSGGLDSSIVAHCLEAGHEPLASVTFFSPSADGDERAYAQLAAENARSELYEITLQADDIDLTRTPEMALANPGPHIIAQHMDQLIRDVGARAGSDAFFNGGGGDNVFCLINSIVPAVDRWRSERSWSGTWRTLSDLSELLRIGKGDVCLRFIKRLKDRDRSVRWQPEREFLRGPAPEAEHPWLEGANLNLPGKCRHIRSLIGIQGALDGFGRSLDAPLEFPLLTQPIVEACLAIPSWKWVEGGRDRAVARNAFARYLPRRLIARRSKGALDGLFGQIYLKYRHEIAELLLGGRLASEGLLDRPSVMAYISKPLILTDRSFYRLIELAGFEIWSRHWD